jgi:hypothetical protein
MFRSVLEDSSSAVVRDCRKGSLSFIDRLRSRLFEFAPPMLRKSENCVHMICGHSEFLQFFATVRSILASGRSEFSDHSEGPGPRSVALLYRLVLRIESLLFERSH